MCIIIWYLHIHIYIYIYAYWHWCYLVAKQRECIPCLTILCCTVLYCTLCHFILHYTRVWSVMVWSQSMLFHLKKLHHTLMQYITSFCSIVSWSIQRETVANCIVNISCSTRLHHLIRWYNVLQYSIVLYHPKL